MGRKEKPLLEFFEGLTSKFYLRASLGESEDVVDEEQYVLAFFVTEVLCYGQTSQSDTGTGAGGLVHLPVHKRHLEIR